MNVSGSPGVRVSSPTTDPTGEQILAGVAEVLAAGDPTMWRRLLADHLSDDRGRCTACHISGVGSPHWPCTLRTVAEQAQQLATVAITQAAPGRTGLGR